MDDGFERVLEAWLLSDPLHGKMIHFCLVEPWGQSLYQGVPHTTVSNWLKKPIVYLIVI